MNKTRGAADSELYINKCKAEKHRNLYLVTALTAQVATAFARTRGLQLGTTFIFKSRSLGSGTEQPTFRREESGVSEMCPRNLYILEHKLGLVFM